MQYALLVYADRAVLAEAGRALHDPTAYFAHETGPARLLAHYRLRSPEHTTTFRFSGDELTQSPGPAVENHETLRALFLVEGDREDAVLEIAAQLPAVRSGATVEVWPLIETSGGHDRHSAARHRPSAA
jgi:hypothetical protein